MRARRAKGGKKKKSACWGKSIGEREKNKNGKKKVKQTEGKEI